VPDETTTNDNAGNTDEDEADLENQPPDESTLLGATGVEEEVLAELARAEAELSDPNAPDEPEDEKGAQV
jgi:hypothetical protein